MEPELAPVLLAHGGAGGVNLELLIVAIAMVGLGVVFFVQKTTKPIVPIVLVLTGIALGIGGIATSRPADDHPVPVAHEVDHQATVDGLCEARAEAVEDPSSADALFNEAHLGLHELADSAAAEDRVVAGRLLEAKGAVESALQDEDVEGGKLERAFVALIDATVEAGSVVGEEVTGCS
ncbi:MAG: hypothetical protein M3N53_14660 [Actinomycetota bacterium]|nr:hypothetical protein [Actinomycetota bacterium]